MHRSRFKEKLLQLDEETQGFVDLTHVPEYQQLSFKQLRQIFSLSVMIEDVEGMLLSGVAMLQQVEEMSESDNPYRVMMADIVEPDFSYLTFLMEVMLPEISS